MGGGGDVVGCLAVARVCEAIAALTFALAPTGTLHFTAMIFARPKELQEVGI